MPAIKTNRKIALIPIIGLIVSFGAFFIIKNWEESISYDEFSYKANDHAAAIQIEIENLIKNVEDIRARIEYDINIGLNDPLVPNVFMSPSEKAVIY